MQRADERPLSGGDMSKSAFGMIRLYPIAGMAIGPENVAVSILANLHLAPEDLAATPDQQAQRLKDNGT